MKFRILLLSVALGAGVIACDRGQTVEDESPTQEGITETEQRPTSEERINQAGRNISQEVDEEFTEFRENVASTMATLRGQVDELETQLQQDLAQAERAIEPGEEGVEGEVEGQAGVEGEAGVEGQAEAEVDPELERVRNESEQALTDVRDRLQQLEQRVQQANFETRDEFEEFKVEIDQEIQQLRSTLDEVSQDLEEAQQEQQPAGETSQLSN